MLIVFAAAGANQEGVPGGLSAVDWIGAGVILRTRRPFRRGDQVSTNDCEGVVEDVNFRTVRLRTYAEPGPRCG